MGCTFLESLSKGIPLIPLPPPRPVRDGTIPHAPIRKVPLSDENKYLAVRNALRYFPAHFHEILKPEFEEELHQYGHIYMYRFIPNFLIKAYPVGDYPAKTLEGRAIMLMVCNNLDHTVAQFPHELVTYGGNGQVLSNWAQVKNNYTGSMTKSPST
jgi:urocanate hydratase